MLQILSLLRHFCQISVNTCLYFCRDFHCGLIGYQQQKKLSTARVPHSKAIDLQPVPRNPNSTTPSSPRIASEERTFHASSNTLSQSSQENLVANSQTNSAPGIVEQEFCKGKARSLVSCFIYFFFKLVLITGIGLPMKRKGNDHVVDTARTKRQERVTENSNSGRKHQWEAQVTNFDIN